jgi:transcriptional regulator with XRE-family HTH domain
MTTRVVFDREFLHAAHIRGLTISELAQRAHLSPATVSAAVHGRPVNVRSAVLMARTLAACPIIKELEEWATGRHCLDRSDAH